MIKRSNSVNIQNSEKLTIYLKRLPIGRCDYYIESKSLYGYNEDLMFEIKTLLKDFKETEKEYEHLRGKFLAYLEENEKVTNGKDNEIYVFLNEIDKIGFITKNLQAQNKELIGRNEEKDEKVNILNVKNEELECQIEGLQNELQNLNNEIMFCRSFCKGKQMPNSLTDFKNFVEDYFLENISEIKMKHPDLFCQCFGNLEFIKKENLFLKKHLDVISLELSECKENLQTSEAKNMHLEYELKILKKQNQIISIELNQIIQSKGKFLADMENEILYKTKNQLENLRISSFSNIEINKELDESPKLKRTPLNRDRKKKPISLNIFKEKEEECIHRKTDSLLSDLENSFGDKSSNEMMLFEEYLQKNHSFDEIKKRKIKNKLSLLSRIVNEDLRDCAEETNVMNCSSIEKNWMNSIKSHSSETKVYITKWVDWEIYAIFWSFCAFYRVMCFVFTKNSLVNVVSTVNNLVGKTMTGVVKTFCGSVLVTNFMIMEFWMSIFAKIKKFLRFIVLMKKSFISIKQKI